MLYIYLGYFVTWSKDINETMVKYILLTKIIIPVNKDRSYVPKSSAYY